MDLITVAASALKKEARERMDGFPLYDHEAEEIARAVLAAVAREVGVPGSVEFGRAEELLAALATAVA